MKIDISLIFEIILSILFVRAAGFLLACLPGGSSQDDAGTADCFF